jgi:phage terminase large subunit-like protein
VPGVTQLEGKVQIGDVVIDLARLGELSPGALLQARDLLEQAEQIRVANPLAFYKPNGPKYERFHNSRDRLKGIQGGNRSGKTTTAIVDDIIQATPRDLLPERLQAIKQYDCPFYCRVMTPDMERTMKPVIHQKLKEWLPTSLIPKGFDAAYDKQANCLRLDCGCRFDFLSYEMAVDKFGGAALHRCHYDEEPPEEIRNECLMRLVDFNGDELFSFTPLKGLTWSYRRIFKNRNHPGVTLEQVSMRDNPNLNAAGVARVLDDDVLGLDATQKEMREHGRFTNQAGMVYPNVRDWLIPAPDPRSVAEHEVLVGIDPGITKCGLTWTAHEHSERFVTFDARELRGNDVGGWVDEIHRTNRRWGLTPEQIAYAVDPAAVARSMTNRNVSVESELIRLGIYAEHGENDVDAGVLMLLRLGGKGLWVISDALEHFIETLEEYPLEEKPDGSIHPAKNGREHLADAQRYAISLRAWPDAPEARQQTVYPDGHAQHRSVHLGGPPPGVVPRSVMGDMV